MWWSPRVRASRAGIDARRSPRDCALPWANPARVPVLQAPVARTVSVGPTLAMLALAFIMACAAAAATPSPSDRWHYAYIPGPIALTAAEIRRLFSGLATGPLRDRLPGPARAISEIQHWTNWRRHHQGIAAKATTSADSPLNSTHNELTLPY